MCIGLGVECHESLLREGASEIDGRRVVHPERSNGGPADAADARDDRTLPKEVM